MKLKHLLITTLAVLLALPLGRAVAQTIEVVTSFDYPGNVTQTIPEGINDRGDIAGLFVDTSGVTSGFVRFHSGTFSDPIVEPNDQANLTHSRGINHARAVVGFYGAFDGSIHGYFLQGGNFTELDVAGAINTYGEGLNNPGDYVGASDETGLLLAYRNLGGVHTPVVISNATQSYAFGINQHRQATGQYTDTSGVIHGYFCDTDGSITTFDPNQSTATLPFGLNDRPIIVGRYIALNGINHGFLLKLPHGFIKFDFPGSVFTSLNGINNDGLLCGRYDSGDGILHGFLARVVTP